MKCDWCDSENTEVVGREYNGLAIKVCRDCGHEFIDTKDYDPETDVLDLNKLTQDIKDGSDI